MTETILIFFNLSWLGLLFGFNYFKYISLVLIVGVGLVVFGLDWEFYSLGTAFYSDCMSMSFIILSSFISLLMIYSSYKIYLNSDFSSGFTVMIYGLFCVLLFSFYTGDYLLFYLFFEVSLIPTLLIITGWGYQPERLQAGVYFLFYTLFASLPLLLLFVYLSTEFSNLSYIYMMVFPNLIYGVGEMLLVGVFGSLAFLIKLPMFFTHLWLPKAHVEAPVAGSMILAGVLLKLGGYGFMRFSKIGESSFNFISPYFLGLSLFGMVSVGVLCCRLNDFKALVAYSSVAHMAMVICGVFTLFIWGFYGSLVMMIGHGLSSSGLFYMVNMYYERTSSRSFFVNKGLLLLFPVVSMFVFLLSVANIAAPPTVNLLSEIMLMISLIGYDYLMLLVFPLGSFLGAVFTLFMFSYSQHGKIYYSFLSCKGVTFREFHIFFLHVIPVNFMILNSSMFFSGF